MSAELNELAERVEALSGPDREVDALIALAIDWTSELYGPARELLKSNSASDIGKYLRDLPAYTGSLDASMTLVPEGCLAMVKHLWDGPKRAGYAFVSEYTADAEDCDGKRWVTDYQGCAETPALALTAAALRARSQAA